MSQRSTIYIIRHGQTALNKARVLQGRSDQPLDEKGVAQARRAGEYFRSQGIRFDRVWSSPLRRAVDTARYLAGEEAAILTDPRLIEMDYGPYEGMDLHHPAPEVLAFFKDFSHAPAPAGMEPLNAVIARLGSFLEELRPAPGGENILLSTHAIAMKGALEYLTPGSRGAYWSTFIGNCEVYSCVLENERFTVPGPLKMG